MLTNTIFPIFLIYAASVSSHIRFQIIAEALFHKDVVSVPNKVPHFVRYKVTSFEYYISMCNAFGLSF